MVYGVNEDAISAERNIVSAASCTTNAITPILKTINDRYGIESGHIETVHAYTNDQNLIDNYHSKNRRGRGAPLNMVLTETGAAKAVAKALPELKGLLTANAIRVPTPNVSMAIMKLNLKEEVTTEAINDHLKWAAIQSPLHRQIGHTASNEVASTDLVGSRHAGVVDSKSTTIAQGKPVCSTFGTTTSLGTRFRYCVACRKWRASRCLFCQKRSRNSHVKLLRLAAGAFFHGIKGRTLCAILEPVNIPP